MNILYLTAPINNSDVMRVNIMSTSNVSAHKLLNCEHCGKSFPTNYRLKRHMLTHTKEKVSLQCQHCSKCFFRKHHFNFHMKFHEKFHMKAQDRCQAGTKLLSSNKLFLCKYCGKSFFTNSHLKRHMVIHSSEKPYHCQHCNKSFSRKDTLSSHMKVHEKPIKAQQYQPFSKSSTNSITVCKWFCCEQCSKSFPTRSRLKRHMITHSGEKPHHCQYCNKSFSRKDTLSSHMKVHEKPTKAQQYQPSSTSSTNNITVCKLFCCEHCSKSFPTRSRLKRHMMTHKGEKPHHYQHRNKSSRKDTLSSHMKVHKKPTKAQQYQPSSTFSTNNITVCKLFCCEQCSKSFPTRSRLKRHMITHSGEKPHHCQYCNKSFSRKDTLSSHMKVHEKPTKAQQYQPSSKSSTKSITGCKWFCCEQCSKSFPTRSRLKRHIITHSGEKPHHCQQCGKSFARKDYLVSHMKKVHEKSEVKAQGFKPYQFRIRPLSINITVCKLFHCKYCNKYFSSNSRLVQHMSTHTKEIPHQIQNCNTSFSKKSHLVLDNMKVHDRSRTLCQCQHCNKFFSKRYLKIHNRIHTGERPYQCEYCSMSFIKKYELTVHNRMHTGERPFQCKHCGKSFATNQRLTLHSYIHAEVKPYQCQLCIKSFVSRYQLKIHNRVHTGERPYQCKHCSKSFFTSAQLKRHNMVHTRVRSY